MHWYWIVCIAVGAAALLYAAIGVLLFFAAFRRSPKMDTLAKGAENTHWAPYIPRMRETHKRMQTLPHATVTHKSFDGVMLYGDYYEQAQSARIVILVHGYYSLPWWDFSVIFNAYYDAGYSILAVEDRAHGRSGGRFVGFGALDSRDVEGWISDLLEKHPNSHIALHGVSMGASTVLLVTGDQPSDRVVCAVSDCAFSSVGAVAKHLAKRSHLPLLPFLWIVNLCCRRFAGYSMYTPAAQDAVRRSHTPTLFVHGDKDDFVPFAMMQPLYDACTAEKQCRVFSDAQHGESSQRYPQEYADAALSFVNGYMERAEALACPQESAT